MKHNYSVNNDNQLVIKLPGKKKKLVAGGNFLIGKDSRLEYKLNEPFSWRKIYGIPPKIIFSGNWKLNRNYDLEMILDRTGNQFEADTLVIKGDIISADRDCLAFEAKTYDRDGLLHIQILKLAVTLLADKTNRLCLIIKKRVPDILRLEADWKLNGNQQIIYTYEKTELKTKTKVSRVLTFEGFWQISDENKLTYILKYSPDSRFDFRGQIETPSIYSSEGLIKYRLGAGIEKIFRTKEKKVYIYGAWKFSRRLGLSFQVDYGKERISEINFGADFSFNKENEITFSLKNAQGKPLGISVIFTHKFLESLDAQAFLRLKKSYEERRVDFGVRIPF